MMQSATAKRKGCARGNTGTDLFLETTGSSRGKEGVENMIGEKRRGTDEEVSYGVHAV